MDDWAAHEERRRAYKAKVRWQYHIELMTVTERWFSKAQAEEVLNMRRRLESLGGDGWEMISFEIVPLVGRFTGKVTGNMYLTFFKRPVPAADEKENR